MYEVKFFCNGMESGIKSVKFSHKEIAERFYSCFKSFVEKESLSSNAEFYNSDSLEKAFRYRYL